MELENLDVTTIRAARAAVALGMEGPSHPAASFTMTATESTPSPTGSTSNPTPPERS